MDEKTYYAAVANCFEAVNRCLDKVDSDEELEFDEGDGKLVVENEAGVKVILSRQRATQEIWLAEPGGGWHFKHDGSSWKCTKRDVTLQDALTPLISMLLGRDVKIDF